MQNQGTVRHRLQASLSSCVCSRVKWTEISSRILQTRLCPYYFILKVEMQCQNDFTSSYIVWNRCGTMPKFQWKNRLTFRDIYIQSWQNHSFPIIFRKHTPRAWHLVVTSHMTQETIFPGVPSCRSRPACIKKCLFMRAKRLWDGIWHSAAWIPTFWPCLAVR